MAFFPRLNNWIKWYRDEIAILSLSNELNRWIWFSNGIFTFKYFFLLLWVKLFHFTFFSLFHFNPPGFKFVNEMTERDVCGVVRTKHQGRRSQRRDVLTNENINAEFWTHERSLNRITIPANCLENKQFTHWMQWNQVEQLIPQQKPINEL